MRLFIAIRLNDEMKRVVKGVQDSFREENVRGNYIPEENMHITLAFIGEYHDPDEVMDALEGVTFSSFPITMTRVGCFRDLWWTGFEKNEHLESLARKVRHALAEAGIPYDRKKFKCHVTFLRKARAAHGESIPPVRIRPAKMQVEGISLMRSTRGKNGMIYTEIGAVQGE